MRYGRAARKGGRVYAFLLPFAIALVFTALSWQPGVAQSSLPPNLSADQLSRLQQQYQQRQDPQRQDQQSDFGTDQRPVMTLPTAVQPALPPSRLEQIMSARAGVPLRQFGYDQFGSGRPVSIAQTGAVQDDYLLGPGDEIVVSLRGQENGEYRASVDRNGQVVMPRLRPVPASGRSFGSFRADLEAAFHRAFIATDASISLGRVRQISVLVSGEVNSPGLRILTGLSSAVDAILLSGGVKKTGSLRNIRIQRGGHEYTVDLYSVLTSQGRASPLRLADGDRILVPLLGPTIAVAGLVRQPGIYELQARQPGMSVSALLQLAGGQEVRGSYRLTILRIQPNGSTELVAATPSALVRDSEVLFAQPSADLTSNQATLSGGTGLAGRYAVTAGTKLSDFLKAPGALGPTPYTLFGIVSRKDPRTLLRSLAVFTPMAVLAGKEDMSLQTDDIVRVLSVNEMRLLTTIVKSHSEDILVKEEAIRDPVSAAVSSDGQGEAGSAVAGAVAGAAQAANATSGQRAAFDQLAARRQGETANDNYGGGTPLNPDVPNEVRMRASGDPQNSSAPQNPSARRNPPMPQDQPAANFQEQIVQPGEFATNREIRSLNDLARQLDVDALVLMNFMIDHEATLEGAVRGPGIYFVGPTVELRDLIQAAGGTLSWADQSSVELTTTLVDAGNGRSTTQRVNLPLTQGALASYIVKSRDQFRFNQTFTDALVGQVVLQGQVRFTGSYDIKRGERLSDVLARAGGLTNAAYPYGTVFLRKSAAALEREGYVRAAREVEDQLVVAMTRVGNDKIEPGTFAAMQTFVSELRNQKPLGRISFTADPSVLAAKPQLDPLLEAGDVIYVPQRPSTISVLGHVMQPGNYPYMAGESVGDYIQRAGGYARFADDSDTFVVLPDGSARKVEKSWLNFDATSLPPGSAIVVPRDIAPLDLRQTIIDVSQIFSQFAIAIASVAVLSKQ